MASGQTGNPIEIVTEQSKDGPSQITSSVPLTEGEKILWHRDSRHGLIHKEVAFEEAITNKRCVTSSHG